MKKDKQKRLESAGWRVGSTTDFLGLSEEEAKLVELKLRLAQYLRERRTRNKLSQQAVATKIRSSQSRVAKMEAADSSVSIELILRSLFSLGATHKEVARVIAA